MFIDRLRNRTPWNGRRRRKPLPRPIDPSSCYIYFRGRKGPAFDGLNSLATSSGLNCAVLDGGRSPSAYLSRQQHSTHEQLGGVILNFVYRKSKESITLGVFLKVKKCKLHTFRRLKIPFPKIKLKVTTL